MKDKRNKKDKRGWKNKIKSNLEITFDEQSRKEYLTGFQKRNQEKKLKRTLYKQQQIKDLKKQFQKDKKSTLKEQIQKTFQDLNTIESIQQAKSSALENTLESYNTTTDELHNQNTNESNTSKITTQNHQITVTIQDYSI